MNQHPGNVLALIPNKSHQAQVVVHPKSHSISVLVVQILQPGMVEHRLIGLEETSKHRPATAFAIVGFVKKFEYLFPSDRPWTIGGNDTISPERLAGREQYAGFTFLLEIVCNGDADPDVLNK